MIFQFNGLVERLDNSRELEEMNMVTMYE